MKSKEKLWLSLAVVGSIMFGCAIRYTNKLYKMPPLPPGLPLSKIPTQTFIESAIKSQTNTIFQGKKEWMNIAWNYNDKSNIVFNIRMTTNENVPKKYWWIVATVTNTTYRLYITNFPSGFFTVSASNTTNHLESEY